MASMDLLKYFFVSLFVSLQFQPSQEGIGTIIAVAQIAIDVAGLAKSVDELFDEEQTDEPDDISNEELLANINDLIGSAKTDIITSVLELSKLERIEATVEVVHSSLVDLRKIIEAKDPMIAKAYQDDFVRHYSEHDVVKHVRFLTEILTYKIPGQQFELLSHMTEKTRCNLTALAEFAEFFLGLVSDGIALQVMYNRLTNSAITLTQVIEDEWGYGLRKIQADLDKVEQDCISQFQELAKADFESSTSATALGQNNAQRYVHNWTDVMFYSQMGTDQFHYRKHAADLLFYQNTEAQIKVAVVGSREQGKIWDATKVSKNLSESGFTVPAKDDLKAAWTVGETVEAHVKKLGYSIGAIVVYFEGLKFPEKGTFRAKDSPVATFEIPGVVLQYCYYSGFGCFFHEFSLRGDVRETASGKFKIFVYPHTRTDLTYTTGGGAALKSSVAIMIVLVGMLVCDI